MQHLLRLGRRLQDVFKRKTTSGSFIPELDGLRFFAIAGVVLLHHMGQILAKHGLSYESACRSFTGVDYFLIRICRQGQFGVPLFFAISGFILSLPFARWRLSGESRPGLTRYFIRRLSRLEPPYILSMLIHYPIVAFLFTHGLLKLGGTWTSMLGNLAASLCYVHNSIFQTSSLLNGVAWSLEVEVQFYVLAPLLCAAFAVRSTALRRAFLGCVILLFGALNDFIFPQRWWATYSLAGYLQYFLAGFLLSDFYVMSDWEDKPRRMSWDVIGITTAAALLWCLLSDLPRYALPFLVLASFVGGFRGRILNRLLRNPALWAIGGMCYSIYLYHAVLVAIAAKVTAPLYGPSMSFAAGFLWQSLLALPFVLFVCAFLYLAVEKPCMDREWPKKLWSWLSGPRAVR